MTPSLRTKHRVIWFLLSVLLPLFLVATVLIRPQEFNQDVLPQALDKVFPNVIQSQSSDAFIANLRSRSDGQRQLEIILKTPLTTPAATVYVKASKDTTDFPGWVLGKLSSSGIHRFTLDNSIGATPFQLRIYDPVKTETLWSTSF